MERTDIKTKNKALELLAQIEDDELGSSFLRGISVYQANDLIKCINDNLPSLWVTLHHADRYQIYPRLRGWSSEPRVERSTGHPDWGTQKDIALFEAYVGMPKAIWISDPREIEEKPLEERIKEDMTYLKKQVLSGISPILVLPEEHLYDHGLSKGIWARNGTKIYRIK